MFIGKAIQKINPDARFQYEGEHLDGKDNDNGKDCVITWLEGTAPISREDIAAMIPTVEAEWNNSNYARDRKSSYPEISEFMEAYTEKEIGGDSTKWDAYVIKYNKVRTENPK